MKKLLLATAVLVSTNASALDFTVLAGVDSNNGPAVAAEIGVGYGLIGFKAMGGFETTSYDRSTPSQDNKITESQSDVSFYAGYRLPAGFSAKIGFAMSTYEAKDEEQTFVPLAEVAFRPMIGIGYDFTSNITMDIHYTTGSKAEPLETTGKTYTFEDSVTIMAGFRF